MNSQTPKMRLIAMFYLMVFTSALLVWGLGNYPKVISYSNAAVTAPLAQISASDTVQVATINQSIKAQDPLMQQAEEEKETNPLRISINLKSVLQVILGLASKSF